MLIKNIQIINIAINVKKNKRVEKFAQNVNTMYAFLARNYNILSFATVLNGNFMIKFCFVWTAIKKIKEEKFAKNVSLISV